MNMLKIVLSGAATVALTFGGIAQAESIRAGASLPVAKAGKLSRKAAKRSVTELNQVEGQVVNQGGKMFIYVLAGVGAGAGLTLVACKSTGC